MPTKQYFKKLNGKYVKDEDARESARLRIIRCETVSAMKTSSGLASGDRVRTAGYYASGDGGEAEYTIIEGNYTADDGSIIALDNGLYAKLLDSYKVNVKQYGAKGDGVTDDSNAFVAAIAMLKASYSSNNIFAKNLTLTIPNGKYLVTDTIEIPIVVKLKIDGDVLILSDVSEGPTLWINSGGFEIDSSAKNVIKQQAFNIASTIGGTGVLCIERNTVNPQQDVNDSEASSIAIEIGDREYNANALRCGRSSYKNIAISGFATGIKLNTIHTYLINFENLKLERNRIDFIYGDTLTDLRNSGENIKFRSCAFAQAYNAFVNNKYGEFTFNNCSFDFNGNAILTNAPAHLILYAPHFEGVGFYQEGIVEATDENCTGYGTVVYANYDSANGGEITKVEINNPYYYLASSNNKLIPRYQSKFNGVFPNLKVVHNSYETYNEAGYTYDNAVLNGNNVEIEGFRTPFRNSTLPVIPFNNRDKVGKLDVIDNALSSLESLSNNYLYSVQNLDSVSVNTSDKIFNKSLQFALSNQSWFNIRRTLNCGYGKKLTSLAWFDFSNLVGDSDTIDHFACVAHVLFYNKNHIYTGDEIQIYYADEHFLKDDNSDWFIMKPFVVDVPEGTSEILVSYNFSVKNSGGTSIPASGNALLGGLILENLY